MKQEILLFKSRSQDDHESYLEHYSRHLSEDSLHVTAEIQVGTYIVPLYTNEFRSPSVLRKALNRAKKDGKCALLLGQEEAHYFDKDGLFRLSMPDCFIVMVQDESGVYLRSEYNARGEQFATRLLKRSKTDGIPGYRQVFPFKRK